MQTYEGREVERNVYAVWAPSLNVGDDFYVETTIVAGRTFREIFRVVSTAELEGKTVRATVKKVDDSLASGRMTEVSIHLRS